MPEAELPRLVSDHLGRALGRALSAGAPLRGQVRLTQLGEMIMKPGARPIHFTATERFAVDRTAFVWEARFRIGRLLPLRVTDGFNRGGGVLKVRVFGLPLQTNSSREVVIGEAYRYLAELPWIPQAMAANRELQWREVGARAVEVSVSVGDERPAVTLEFDDAGDIVRSSAPARPRQMPSGGYAASAWAGDFSAYETLAGIRLPTRGEVYWELPEGRFIYWRGQITGADNVNQPLELPWIADPLG